MRVQLKFRTNTLRGCYLLIRRRSTDKATVLDLWIMHAVRAGTVVEMTLIKISLLHAGLAQG